MVSPGDIESFAAGVVAQRPDVVLIGGDTSESKDLVAHLSQLARLLRVPIYFVLGNHDYYYGSIEAVRQRVVELCRREPLLHYLSAAETVVELSPDTALVGHDGWADGRLADYFASTVMMNDELLIAELIGLSRAARWERLKALADEAAAHVRRVLPLALRYPQAVLLMHVPPFREACWYAGEISNDNWLPHFTCHAVGEAIRDVMSEHPHRALTVLCGHTHGRGEASPLPNVQVFTGGAQYGRPEIQRMFDF